MEYFYLRDDYQLFVDIAKSNDAVISELQATYERNPPEMVSKGLCLPSDPSPPAFEHDGLPILHRFIAHRVISNSSLCLCHSGYHVEALFDALTLEVGGIRVSPFSGGLQLLGLPCGDVPIPPKMLCCLEHQAQIFSELPVVTPRSFLLQGAVRLIQDLLGLQISPPVKIHFFPMQLY